MATLVGAKGQVTIEKQFRDRLGVEPGWRAIQRLDGDRLVLEFRPPKHQRSLYGVLAGKARRTFATAEELEAAIEEAWCLAVEGAADKDVRG
jgi:bifunctional DNA-binding transcriptional regulator/antitoxin component of YhaV-PrlF toxin-antitoxin module